MKDVYKKLSIYFTGDALREAKEIMYKADTCDRCDFLSFSLDESKSEIIDFLLVIKDRLIKSKEIENSSNDKYFE